MLKTFKETPASKMSLALRKPVFGVGVNDANYTIVIKDGGKQVTCPYYRKWHNMLRRCYDPKFHEKHPTYINCKVCDEWLVFSNFKGWMSEHNWEGKDLDKDILVNGNKIYAPNACIFIPHEVNTLLNDSGSIRGEFPIGVTIDNRDGRFTSRIKLNGKTKHLGRFSTQEEAHKAYIAFKEDHVHKIALEQEEPLRTALLNWRAIKTPH